MRGRFAPSPSGEMHLGNAWTALLAWLQVRSAAGSLVLRIEDLDPDRSRPQFSRQLLEDLSWLGLEWDEGPDTGGNKGPYCQNERRLFYTEALDSLKRKGRLYPCYCTREEIREASLAPHEPEVGRIYPGTCRQLSDAQRREREASGRQPAWRLEVPTQEIGFSDLCQGEVSQNLSEAGDFVLQRADGVHAYQLAVVVDDALMGITHVLRGDDLLPSTARQIFLYRALELPPPSFAHVPLLLGLDGHRLSKRHGDLSLASLRRRGVRAEQIIGYLAGLAGMTPKGEAVTARELVPVFSLEALSKTPLIVRVESIVR